jgi:protocatechuate 3,4-dioxygenase beta subunit
MTREPIINEPVPNGNGRLALFLAMLLLLGIGMTVYVLTLPEAPPAIVPYVNGYPPQDEATDDSELQVAGEADTHWDAPVSEEAEQTDTNQGAHVEESTEDSAEVSDAEVSDAEEDETTQIIRPSRQPHTNEAWEFIIQGTVTNRQGIPVEGAVIYSRVCTRAGSQYPPAESAVTNALGEYSFTRSGRHRLEQVDVYLNYGKTHPHIQRREKDFTQGEIRVVDFVVPDTVTLSGQVLDLANQPVAGVAVRITRREYQGLRLIRSEFGPMLTTDADGRVSVTLSAIGTYRLEMESETFDYFDYIGSLPELELDDETLARGDDLQFENPMVVVPRTALLFELVVAAEVRNSRPTIQVQIFNGDDLVRSAQISMGRSARVKRIEEVPLDATHFEVTVAGHESTGRLAISPTPHSDNHYGKIHLVPKPDNHRERRRKPR